MKNLKEPYERLAFARHQKGFKQATDAAKYYGWNENTYRSHENGQRGFKNQAKQYAESFQVPVEWLLYGIDNANAMGTDADRLKSMYTKIKTLGEAEQDAYLAMSETFLESLNRVKSKK